MSASRQSNLRDTLRIYAPAVLLSLLGFIVAYQFVDPAPPDRLVIAAGRAEGAYARHAARYAEILGRDGVTLEIRETRGSLENLELLAAGEVDVGFVQGGTEDPGRAGLLSLGSLYFEPAWLFYRGARMSERLPDLKGLRLAVGPVGSGTRMLAETLLRDNALEGGAVTVLAVDGREAVEALKTGEVDAAFFVLGADSPLIEELVRAPDLRLMSFSRAHAYTRLHPFLSAVVLPEGLIDMLANIPDRDVHLVAPTATLVTREDVHPALQDLLLQALPQVHGDGGWFEDQGRFPSPDFLVYPLSPEARRYYEHGPSLLQRYLPFWAATLVDRLKVMLLPLIVVLIPLLRLMPPIYAWRMRAKIYRWYKTLEVIELKVREGPDAARLQEIRAELGRIEREVRKVHVPPSFAAQAYELRIHIRLVRDSLVGKAGSVEPSG